MIWLVLTTEIKDGEGIKTLPVGKFPLTEREYKLIAENWQMFCHMTKIDPKKVRYLHD
jgi:hypothetical protein